MGQLEGYNVDEAESKGGGFGIPYSSSSIHPSQLSRVVTSPGLTHRQRQLFTYAQFRITS